jgi:hypothetical protein
MRATRGGTPQVMRVLPPATIKLERTEGDLRSSGAWRPMAHAAWIQTAANWGTHIGIALADLGINVRAERHGVSGTRADLSASGLGLSLNGAATYSINEMRSVKYNERQYFDHPAFGVIAVVSPIGNRRSTRRASPVRAGARRRADRSSAAQLAQRERADKSSDEVPR